MNAALILKLMPPAAISILGSSWDILTFSMFVLVTNWDYVKQNAGLFINPVVNSIQCLLLSLILLQSIRYVRGLQQQSSAVMDGVPKPMLFPCRTSHTRLFPKKNTFSYSYLLAGVPIGWKGSVGGFLSADVAKRPESWYTRLLSLKPSGNSWYKIDPADYLEPGYVHLGLDGKLERYLQTQGARRKDYPYVYLVTAPKFMGYVSNPISLWCLYSAEKDLTAMILEVNNTFNERRMYFVRADDLLETDTTDKDLDFDWQNIEKAAYEFDATQQRENPKATAKFIKRWAKDFYVSPLNSRKGAYSLIAYDPFFPAMTGSGPLNVTITLNSNNAHAKLIARVFSTGPALDPANMSIWEKTRFLAAWWWVGLATFFPRTVYQAGVLVVKQNLQFFSRPEPLKSTIGRLADSTEKTIESAFRDYLRRLVENARAPVVVKYTPAGILEAPEEVMTSPAAQLVPAVVEELEVKVLTPLFYSRFVRYLDDLDAFHHEFYQSRTIWLSNPLILLDFLPDQPASLSSQTQFGRWEYACFVALQKLRIRPAPIEGPTIAKDVKTPEPPPAPMREPVNDSPYTELEAYILAEAAPSERAAYMKNVLKLFISDHVALGSLDLLGLEVFVLRCLLVWMLARSCVFGA